MRTNGGGAHSRRLSLVAAIVDADPVCDGGPYTPDSNLEAFVLNVLKSMRRGMAAAPLYAYRHLALFRQK